MTNMPDAEPEHEISPTAHLLDEIASTAIVPSQTKPTRDRCPKSASLQALSPTCSTPSSPR